MTPTLPQFLYPIKDIIGYRNSAAGMGIRHLVVA
jgi:hypothetical protein